MNFISNWLYDNAIKCRVRGAVYGIRYALDVEMGLWDGKMFHESYYQQTGANAIENEMVCVDCGKHIYL